MNMALPATEFSLENCHGFRCPFCVLQGERFNLLLAERWEVSYARLGNVPGLKQRVNHMRGTKNITIKAGITALSLEENAALHLFQALRLFEYCEFFC